VLFEITFKLHHYKSGITIIFEYQFIITITTLTQPHLKMQLGNNIYFSQVLFMFMLHLYLKQLHITVFRG